MVADVDRADVAVGAIAVDVAAFRHDIERVATAASDAAVEVTWVVVLTLGVSQTAVVDLNRQGALIEVLDTGLSSARVAVVTVAVLKAAVLRVWEVACAVEVAARLGAYGGAFGQLTAVVFKPLERREVDHLWRAVGLIR